MRDTFDRRLGLNEKIQGIIYGKERLFAGDQPVGIMRENREKVVRMLENISLLERKVKKTHQALIEDLIDNVDYIDEKTHK